MFCMSVCSISYICVQYFVILFERHLLLEAFCRCSVACMQKVVYIINYSVYLDSSV